MRERKLGFLFVALLENPSIAPRLVALESLRLPAYRYLLLNSVFIVMGSEARLMAQAWLILMLTNSDAWVGTTNGLPAIVAAATALLGGVLADRRERRTMLIVLSLAMATVALLTALLIATGTIQIWHLLALAFIIAVLHVSRMTASQTMIVDIVPREQLFGANALFSAASNIALVIGPALAGIILANAGVEYAFYFSAFLFVMSAITAARIHIAPRERKQAMTSVWHDLLEGLRFVGQTPVLQWLLVLGISAVSVGAWLTLVPRYALDFLDSGATGYGAILSARGIGGLVGVLLLLAAGRVKRLGLILLGCAIGFSLLVVAFAFARAMLLASVIAFGLGIVFVWWPSTLRTAFQLSTTDEMRGRVMSLFSLVGQILTMGWLLGGILSQTMGPQAAMIAVAVFCFGLNGLAYWRSPALRNLGGDE